MHVMVVTYGEPKKGYLNFTLDNLWATQLIALLIWPPPKNLFGQDTQYTIAISHRPCTANQYIYNNNNTKSSICRPLKFIMNQYYETEKSGPLNSI